jgi:hypothetical protein
MKTEPVNDSENPPEVGNDSDNSEPRNFLTQHGRAAVPHEREALLKIGTDLIEQLL